MKFRASIVFCIVSALFTAKVTGQEWETYYAYNNVTQIAVSPTKVYAVSDGSLFSVDKFNDKITVYDRQSGLHGSNISCIYYDNEGEQLLIGYGTGMIDIMSDAGVKYIGDLYDKDMTQRKNIYNVTIHGRTAYLSTHYGVQTFDLRDYTLIDSYWLRPNGEETPIKDVVIQNDSIYAILYKSKDAGNADSLFCASLNDYLVDYTQWKREPGQRIKPDANKGKKYQEGANEWIAGQADGVILHTIENDSIKYKPQGPLSNIAFRMAVRGSKIGIVQGGYEVSASRRSPMVMTMENGQWHNYDASYMSDHLGTLKEKSGAVVKSRDYCDFVFDPEDSSHFFVASFGFGLIEFRNNEYYRHYSSENSILEPFVAGDTYPYFWVDGLRYDIDGNLWMLNNSVNGIKVLMRDSSWCSLTNEACQSLDRSHDLIISNQNPNIKIISAIRRGIGVMDDNGTITDQTDDRATFVSLSSFVDANNEEFTLPRILSIFQQTNGTLLIGTEAGLYYIPYPAALLDGDRRCMAVRIFVPEEEIEDAFGDERVQCFAEDEKLQIWVGTQTSGLYCLSPDFSQVLHHYTSGNSPLLSNDILSLCMMPETKKLFVGSSEGLMSFEEKGSDTVPTENTEGTGIPSYGSMRRWKTHFSYNNIEHIEDANQTVYCISGGALLSINKETEEITPLSLLTGLHGSDIVQAAYNEKTRKTLILYRNGLIDIIYPDGQIKSMPDVLLSTTITPGTFYQLYSYNDCIYICSSLGIMCMNMCRDEISETYKIQNGNSDVETRYVCIMGDSIYTASLAQVYAARLTDNLVDGAVWKKTTLPASSGTIQAIGSIDNTLFVHIDTDLYHYKNRTWHKILSSEKWENLYVHTSSVSGRTNKGIYTLHADSIEYLPIENTPNDMVQSGTNYWIAQAEESIIRWNKKNEIHTFSTNSPFENFAYRIRIAQDKLIMLPGGYMGGIHQRYGNVMIYEKGEWTNITYKDIMKETSGNIYRDFCDVAIDPKDSSHFYVASFGYGLHEFRDNKYFQWYMPKNTINGLESVVEPALGYTWVDGLQWDSEGNLWMLNNSHSGVKVLLKNGTWKRISNVATQDLSRTKDLLIWNSDSRIKIVTCNKSTVGLGVFNDNGTISYSGDDKAVFYTSFIDQNGKVIHPQNIYSICQMANGEIWVGTESGLFIISDVRKLLNKDNHCRRVIIPRNDGTGLGDYLLGEESINAIVEDAAGRKWIGTASSGLYLVSDDGLETIEHFTRYNSPLASNEITALAIHPISGEVFIGTSLGLLSYQSDANTAQSDMNNIYAYPNPVYRDYEGYISITGLMENTVVNIIDAGGNLVCKTRSNGGLAVWDGKLPDGSRATPGVYTALCNAAGGHNVCKILLLNATR